MSIEELDFDDEFEECALCGSECKDQFDDPTSYTLIDKGGEKEICPDCRHSNVDSGAIKENESGVYEWS